ncbi:hypothetical protein RCC94_04210 [Exiguobacterium acetylicum]|uniref:hypothetical protein n=1 Tax=Exiguobacterium acetylicum TaxID=41170 RepID=UPI0027E081B5|nr:hypothetical protein [Exiguobacterium acetylicum]MDQ6466675.1 hypothetical protein [Exiguobacterium acetylicum]
MVPNFIIEGMTIVFTLLVIGCGVIFLPQRWKRYGLILLGLVAIGCSSFWYIRPTLINQQIAENTKLAKVELAHQFPDEAYTVKTQKFSYESSSNPYEIEVKFENEPNVTYFLKMDGNQIKLSSFSFKNGGFPRDLQHEFK